MKKENIIIFEATSTAANYIHDVRELGYNPICIEMPQEDDEKEMQRALHDMQYGLNDEELPEVLMADSDYEKTFEMVKKLNPVLVIPGSDIAIVWATKIAYELGLPSNNPENLKKMTDKKCMQEALKNSGLRYIRSKEVCSFDEAKEYTSEMNYSRYVVKPSIGQSTVGVCICQNDEELKDALNLNQQLSEKNENIKTIIQEYIGGEEYYLDSICCQGVNRVVSAFHYEKILIEGKGTIYDYAEQIDERDYVFSQLEEYNNKVIEAIGIEYGVVHTEYKVDENGPVLIEVNCRPPGPLQKYSILDTAWGEHPTVLSLESYLNPEECLKKHNKPLKIKSNYIIKPLIIYNEINVIKSNVDIAFSDLESFEYAVSFGDNKTYPKTVDLATCGGIVYLINKDKNKLMEDVDAIREMEKSHIDKIFEIDFEE